jgi:hypothetical protein
MSQERLFDSPVVAIALTVARDETGHWWVVVAPKREEMPFRDSDRVRYDGLTRAELLDVLCAEVERQLLLA